MPHVVTATKFKDFQLKNKATKTHNISIIMCNTINRNIKANNTRKQNKKIKLKKKKNELPFGKIGEKFSATI